MMVRNHWSCDQKKVTVMEKILGFLFLLASYIFISQPVSAQFLKPKKITALELSSLCWDLHGDNWHSRESIREKCYKTFEDGGYFEDLSVAVCYNLQGSNFVSDSMHVISCLKVVKNKTFSAEILDSCEGIDYGPFTSKSGEIIGCLEEHGAYYLKP